MKVMLLKEAGVGGVGGLFYKHRLVVLADVVTKITVNHPICSSTLGLSVENHSIDRISGLHTDYIKTASRLHSSLVQASTAWYSLEQPGRVWYSLVESGTAWYSLV